MFQYLKRANLKKHLHVVWFLETERTRTFSISLRAFWSFVCILLLLLLSIPLLIHRLGRQAAQVSTQVEHIRELKRTFVSNLLESESSDVETILAAADETRVEPRPTAIPKAGATPAPTAAATPKVQETTAQPATGVATSLPMVFENIILEPTDGTGTRVRFTLSATPEAGGRSLAGRVCAIATLIAKGEGPGGVVSYPNDTASFVTKTHCPRGLLVRFSRLRPTEVTLPVAPTEIRSLELRFTEDSTNLTNTTTHQNN